MRPLILGFLALLLSITFLACVPETPVERMIVREFDTNGDGVLSESEALHALEEYLRARDADDRPTATPHPTATPQSTPTAIPTPTPRPTATPAPTPDPGPIARLDCGDRGYSNDAFPIRGTSRHIDLTVMHPDRPEDTTNTWPGGYYYFQVLESGRVSGGTTVGITGFYVEFHPRTGEWRYQVHGPTATSGLTMMASGYFSEADIPYNRGWSADNRVTFLTRSPEYDGYRVYVNGHLLPIPFTGIDNILSKPHENYQSGRTYSFYRSYYSAEYRHSDVCIPTSWNYEG